MHNNEKCGIFITLYDFCDINYIYLARTYTFNVLFLLYMHAITRRSTELKQPSFEKTHVIGLGWSDQYIFQGAVPISCPRVSS